MIDRSEFMPIEFYKKEPFTGSERGMLFRLEKEEEQFKVSYWQGPYCYTETKEEKTESHFPFSEEGLQEAVNWLAKAYENEESRWKHIPPC